MPAAAALGLALAFASVAAPPPLTSAERAAILRLSPLPPAPADPTNAVADDPAAARLGQFLFFDPRLSADGATSCATCHDPARAFADARTLAEGARTGTRHTPALWNLAHQRWYDWDGRSDTLWGQPLRAIEGETELASTRTSLVRVVVEDDELRAAYESVFGALPAAIDGAALPERARPVPETPDDPDHAAWTNLDAAQREAIDGVAADLGKAIAAYERRLVSDDAPFDRYVRGLRSGDPDDLAAIDAGAVRGLRLFIASGCTNCHAGPTFSDGAFHAIRMPPLDGGRPRDPGRYRGVELARTHVFSSSGPWSDDPASEAARRLAFTLNDPENWGRFKTPSLRNVAVTAPYMRQGQKPTLRSVLEHYSTFEGALPAGHHGRPDPLLVPVDLDEDEMAEIEAFLRTLTDVDLAPELLRPPASPLLAAPRPNVGAGQNPAGASTRLP